MELCYRNNPRSLFRKYAHLVTWLSNTQLGRDYLKQDNLYIPRDAKVDLLLPNGYREYLGRDKNKVYFQTKVTTRACYAPKLYPALQALDLVSQWIRDFDEAKRILLAGIGQIPFGSRLYPDLARSAHFTVTAFSPDAHTETTSVDGTVFRDPADESFASLMTGNGTGAGDDAGVGDNCPFFGVGGSNPNYSFNYVAILLFDTSAIPDADSITSATEKHHFRGDHNDSWGGAIDLSLGSSLPASNTALVAADYQTRGTTRYATDIEIPAANSDGTWTLNAAGIAAIAKTGITKHCMMLSCDIDRSAPAWNSGYYIQKGSTYADIGTSDKPVLTVTHAAVAAGYVHFLN